MGDDFRDEQNGLDHAVDGLAGQAVEHKGVDVHVAQIEKTRSLAYRHILMAFTLFGKRRRLTYGQMGTSATVKTANRTNVPIWPEPVVFLSPIRRGGIPLGHRSSGPTDLRDISGEFSVVPYTWLRHTVRR